MSQQCWQYSLQGFVQLDSAGMCAGHHQCLIYILTFLHQVAVHKVRSHTDTCSIVMMANRLLMCTARDGTYLSLLLESQLETTL